MFLYDLLRQVAITVFEVSLAKIQGWAPQEVHQEDPDRPLPDMMEILCKKKIISIVIVNN